MDEGTLCAKNEPDQFSRFDTMSDCDGQIDIHGPTANAAVA